MKVVYSMWAKCWEDVKVIDFLGHWWGQETAKKKKERAKKWSRESYLAWQEKNQRRLRNASEARINHSKSAVWYAGVWAGLNFPGGSLCARMGSEFCASFSGGRSVPRKTGTSP